MKTYLAILSIVLMILTQNSATLVAASGTGTVTIQIQGYGTVHGELQNAAIQADDSVAMLMSVNDQLQTQLGSFPLEATGNWSGLLNNSTLTGTIHNVQGKIHICIIFSCNDVEFRGNGDWNGQLETNSSGSGNLTGTITITNSPYPQIAQGQTIPVFGTWTADFAAAIPEFNSNLSPLLAVLAAAITLTCSKLRRK